MTCNSTLENAEPTETGVHQQQRHTHQCEDDADDKTAHPQALRPFISRKASWLGSLPRNSLSISEASTAPPRDKIVLTEESVGIYVRFDQLNSLHYGSLHVTATNENFLTISILSPCS